MRGGVESLGRIRAQGIVLLVVTFAAGVLVGLAGERFRAARNAPDLPSPSSELLGPWRDTLPPMFEQLDLTPDQQARILAIMEEGRPRTDRVLYQMLPRLRAVTDSIRSEIRSVLTSDQLTRMDSLMERMHRKHGPMHRRMRGRGMRGPPPPEP
jgi:Spy/CpxP family protein refolding chaperone